MIIKSKKLTFLLIFLVGFTTFYIWPQPAPLMPTNGSNIVIFGDSLATGVGATAGNDIASNLEHSLNKTVINLGVSGDTTADGLNRLEDLIEKDPRVVIVLLGGNDALQKVPMEQTFSNLSQIIGTIQKYGAAVILVGEPGGLYGNKYEKEYERLAKEYRTFYVSNILSGLLGRNEYMSDYIHPNDAGYKKATKRILPVVKEALEES